MNKGGAKHSNGLSFPEFYARESSIPFYIMLGLYVLSNMLMVINFTPEIGKVMSQVRVIINAVLLWLCPMYFAFNLIIWRMESTTILAGIGSIVAVFGLWNFLGRYYEVFSLAAAALLAVMAYKRDYKTILKIILFAHLITIIAGFVCLKLNLALPRVKIDTVDVGVSLGLIYPNHVGRMWFIVMIIAWYLWGQRYRLATTAIFWIVAVFMWKYIECRTIAGFMVVFPVCWWISTGLTKCKADGGISKALQRVWQWVVTLMPFVCFGITYFMGERRAWLDNLTLFRRGGGFYSFLMRFISAGILFDTYGFPILGRNILAEMSPAELLNGRIYVAKIVDNAYIYYLICYGIIVLTACMLWLSIANRKCVKEKDHALLLMSVFMIGYGLLEIVTFQYEHNFMWFYPLAATAVSIPTKGKTGNSVNRFEIDKQSESEK